MNRFIVLIVFLFGSSCASLEQSVLQKNNESKNLLATRVFRELVEVLNRSYKLDCIFDGLTQSDFADITQREIDDLNIEVLNHSALSIDFDCSKFETILYTDHQYIKVVDPEDVIYQLSNLDDSSIFFEPGIRRTKGKIPWLDSKAQKELNIHVTHFASGVCSDRNILQTVAKHALRASEMIELKEGKYLLSFKLEAQIIYLNRDNEVEFCIPIEESIYHVLINDTGSEYKLDIFKWSYDKLYSFLGQCFLKR